MAIRSRARVSGKTPPAKNTDCQPQRGSITALTRVARTAPVGIPQNIMLTITASRRFGAYSDISATELDSAPPRPSPVRNRQASNWSKVVQRAVSMANIPKINVQATIGHFRPQRSAIGPDNMEENIKPISAATKMGEKVFIG